MHAPRALTNGADGTQLRLALAVFGLDIIPPLLVAQLLKHTGRHARMSKGAVANSQPPSRWLVC